MQTGELEQAAVGTKGEAPNGEVLGIQRNVFALGWVSFFGGLSQDMILPILPLFLAGTLGLSKEFIGLIEGVVTTTVSVLKILAGYASDRWRSRKSLVLAGYLLSAISRPVLAFAGSGLAVLGLRFTDGIGKGIKDAPRDALIAGSSQLGKLGFSFGYHRMLDTFGSVIGPLATFGVLALLAAPGVAPSYELVFLLAGIPALIAVLIIARFVRERRAGDDGKPRISLRALRGPFAMFLAVMLIFTLGNSSDAFLILRAQNVGVAVVAIPLVYALFNLFYAVLSVPAGSLSDRIGRRRVITIGWVIYAAVYLGFGLADSAWMIWPLYALYGLYYATTEGVAKAMVADLVEPAQRGTAYGLYNASIGVMALPASIIAGALWDRVAPSAPFIFGAATATLAVLLLIVLLPRRNGAIGPA